MAGFRSIPWAILLLGLLLPAPAVQAENPACGKLLKKDTRLNGDISDLAFTTSIFDQTVDQGDTVTLTAMATGTSTVTYSWEKDGEAICNQ